MVDVSSETAIPAPMLGGEHEFFQAEKTLSRCFQAGVTPFFPNRHSKNARITRRLKYESTPKFETPHRGKTSHAWSPPRLLSPPTLTPNQEGSGSHAQQLH